MVTLQIMPSWFDINVFNVAAGTAVLSALLGLSGCFVYFQRKALVSDAVSHGVLPGICLAFIVLETKSTVGSTVAAIGFAFLSLVAVSYLTKLRVRSDAAISITLSFFFGLGIVLISYIQKQSYGNASGLDKYIFGKAATLRGQDLLLFFASIVVVGGMVILNFNKFITYCFDADFAQMAGLNGRKTDLLINFTLIVAIVAGIQSVGIVMAAASLIIPPITARMWMKRPQGLIKLSMTIGFCSGLLGSGVSYYVENLPTGPCIAVVTFVCFGLTAILHPENGLIAKAVKDKRRGERIEEENALKALYGKTAGEGGKLLLTLKGRLMQKGLIGADAQLSANGEREARRLIRLHRLWEMYLTSELRLKNDHVHDDAESIEHILDATMEAALIEKLNRPMTDPHSKEIPYE